ncbi:hypothetical protein BJ741DRAFT_654933 [Chytriomyces cf. hyalinus JEL632]|nr:hypothetical protein BJ741DRAFT_654933 [Chytriomyces cf. hyalinus JEL632]
MTRSALSRDRGPKPNQYRSAETKKMSGSVPTCKKRNFPPIPFRAALPTDADDLSARQHSRFGQVPSLQYPVNTNRMLCYITEFYRLRLLQDDRISARRKKQSSFKTFETHSRNLCFDDGIAEEEISMFEYSLLKNVLSAIPSPGEKGSRSDIQELRWFESSSMNKWRVKCFERASEMIDWSSTLAGRVMQAFAVLVLMNRCVS